MYTGIVQGLEKVLEIRQGNGFTTLVISNHQNFFHDVFNPASVAINGGVFKSATHIDLAANQVHFDVSDFYESTHHAKSPRRPVMRSMSTLSQKLAQKWWSQSLWSYSKAQPRSKTYTLWKPFISIFTFRQEY